MFTAEAPGRAAQHLFAVLHQAFGAEDGRVDPSIEGTHSLRLYVVAQAVAVEVQISNSFARTSGVAKQGVKVATCKTVAAPSVFLRTTLPALSFPTLLHSFPTFS